LAVTPDRTWQDRTGQHCCWDGWDATNWDAASCYSYPAAFPEFGVIDASISPQNVFSTMESPRRSGMALLTMNHTVSPVAHIFIRKQNQSYDCDRLIEHVYAYDFLFTSHGITTAWYRKNAQSSAYDNFKTICRRIVLFGQQFNE